MDGKNFGKLIAGLEDALSYAKGQKSPGARVDRVKVDRSFITETRLAAGLTQEEFAKVTGASLGTVRKWEHGERSPSGAAGTLVRILACDPALAIKEAGLAKTATRRRSSGSNKAA